MTTKNKGDHPREMKTLGQYFRDSLRESHKRRPISVYLLLAILVMVLLGSQIVYVREDPKQFAFFLSLNFVFFFMVLFRAIVDFMEIVRNHFYDQEELFRSTLGEDEFIQRLGQQVAASREDGS